MNRNVTTKLVATALAVASLGLAGTASAAEDQGIAIGEPTPGQPVPAQTQEKAPAENPAPEGTDPVAEKSQEQLDRDRFNRYCNMKDAEPSHSDKKFCEDYRNKHGKGGTPDYEKPDYEKPGYEKPNYEKPEPTSYEKASEPSKGSLPFTGLEIWQLGLIGLVLVGGGIGARRLLVA